MEPGRVKLTAVSDGTKLSVTGTTVYDAAEKLINILTK